MSWRDLPLCSFDLETDSPNPEDAHIVTACVGTASLGEWAPKSWLLKPNRPIPAEATSIHGISTEHAESNGTSRATGVRGIRDALLTAWSKGYPVVIYNAPFDLTVLDRESRRHGHGPLPILGPVLDGLVIDKAIDRFRRGSRRLADVCAHYGITLDGAHESTADALASVRLVWKLASLLPDTSLRENLQEVTAWQASQYREQRLSFADYRRKRGEPLDDESTDWPIRPMLEGSAA